MYGAGDLLIGLIIGKGAKAGRKIKEKFLKGLPALKKLIDAVQKAAKRGYLIGLDGRLIHIRSAHAALNALLQSAGALIAKQAIVFFDEMLREAGYSDRAQLVAWIHDEIQVEADPEIADEVGRIAVRAFERAGEHFKFNIPITGEYKVGNSWAETH